MITELALVALLLIGLPVGFVAGCRQARYNAKNQRMVWDDTQTPPLVTALVMMVLWPLALVGWCLIVSVIWVNDMFAVASGADKIVDRQTIERLEAEEGIR